MTGVAGTESGTQASLVECSGLSGMVWLARPRGSRWPGEALGSSTTGSRACAAVGAGDGAATEVRNSEGRGGVAAATGDAGAGAGDECAGANPFCKSFAICLRAEGEVGAAASAPRRAARREGVLGAAAAASSERELTLDGLNVDGASTRRDGVEGATECESVASNVRGAEERPF